MQPIKYLNAWMEQTRKNQHYLFTFSDLRPLYPSLSNAAFKTLLSRAVDVGMLTRVCRGIYLDRKKAPNDGLLLFHTAALIRANEFNYVSLETVLSEVGIISQISLNFISIMSSGRRGLISCGEFGTIEFIHTNQKPNELMSQLSYDSRYGLWRATISQALRDMKATHRNSDLIDWEYANEFI
jgi:hypothetical protein